jgi:hypothetical protein
MGSAEKSRAKQSFNLNNNKARNTARKLAFPQEDSRTGGTKATVAGLKPKTTSRTESRISKCPTPKIIRTRDSAASPPLLRVPGPVLTQKNVTFDIISPLITTTFNYPPADLKCDILYNRWKKFRAHTAIF